MKKYGYRFAVESSSGMLEEKVPNNSTDIFRGYFQMARKIRDGLGLKKLIMGSSDLELWRVFGIPCNLPRSFRPKPFSFFKLSLAGINFEDAEKEVNRFFPKSGFIDVSKVLNFLGLNIIYNRGRSDTSGWERGNDFEDLELAGYAHEALDRIFLQPLNEGQLERKEFIKGLFDERLTYASGAIIHTLIDIYFESDTTVSKYDSYRYIHGKWDQTLYYGGPGEEKKSNSSQSLSSDTVQDQDSIQ